MHTIVHTTLTVEQHNKKTPLVKIIHPLIGFNEELHHLHTITITTTSKKEEIKYLINTIIKLPQTYIYTNKITEHTNFFSFKTNNLTQTTLDFSHNDTKNKFLTHYLKNNMLERNPFKTINQTNIEKLIRITIEQNQSIKNNMKINIYNKHNNKPNSIAFYHQLNKTYFQHIKTIKFTIKYNNNIIKNLTKTNIILIKISQTSKTPLSIYLDYLNFQTTNVPLVKKINPPTELFNITPTKIIGLKIDTKHLTKIQKNHSQHINDSNHKYSKLLEIYKKLKQTKTIQHHLNYPIINTTKLSIKKTTTRIIHLVKQQQTKTTTS